MEGKRDKIEAGRYHKNGGEKKKFMSRRIRINKQWWKWDEDEEVLRDEKRNRRKVISGEKERKIGEGIR